MDPHIKYASIDWSTALREWIPKVEAAEPVRDYHNVLLRLTAHLNDSHVAIYSTIPPPPTAGRGRVLPMQLRPIEGKPVVFGTFKGPSGQEPPIHVGDEIMMVDGKSVEERLAEKRPLNSASTPGALLRSLVYQLGYPYEKDAMQVVFQNDTGRHTVSVTPIPAPVSYPAQPISPVSYKILDSGFGYITLDTMTGDEMEPALNTIAQAKGLILDMRGYPRMRPSLQGAFVPRIIDKPAQTSLWEIPVVRFAPFDGIRSAPERMQRTN